MHTFFGGETRAFWMEGTASEKSWSRSEFGAFEAQHGQWGWEGRGGERAERDDLQEDGARSEDPKSQAKKYIE